MPTINQLQPNFPEHFVKLDYEYTKMCHIDGFDYIFGHVMRTHILEDYKLDNNADSHQKTIEG